MNSRYVLDASALLCLVRDEPGAGAVADLLAHSSISAVNLSEAVAKLSDAGMDCEAVLATLAPLRLRVVTFAESAAISAGLLRRATKSLGLSFGDRACLALAIEWGAQAVTTDRAWAQGDVGATINLVR